MILGKISSLSELPFDRQYYLVTEVENDGEMSPRIELTASPYSMQARKTEPEEQESNIGAGGFFSMTNFKKAGKGIGVNRTTEDVYVEVGFKPKILRISKLGGAFTEPIQKVYGSQK